MTRTVQDASERQISVTLTQRQYYGVRLILQEKLASLLDMFKEDNISQTAMIGELLDKLEDAANNV